MTDLEYNSFIIPDELLGLCNNYTLMKKSQNERKPDMIYLMLEVLKNTYVVTQYVDLSLIMP